MEKITLRFENGVVKGYNAALDIARAMGIELKNEGSTPSTIKFSYRGCSFRIEKELDEEDVKNLIKRIRAIKKYYKRFEPKVEVKTFEI